MAVIAPADIGDGGAGVNGAEVLALRRNNQHAAWTGGEQVTGGIKLEAVAAAATSLEESMKQGRKYMTALRSLFKL